LNGTYVAVEPFHLFRYVDEQAFRFNNRQPMNDSNRFSFVVRKIVGKRLMYKELTGKTAEQPKDAAPFCVLYRCMNLMSLRQEIFDLAQVESIGCLCNNCGSEMIITIANAEFRSDQCPNCGNSWYPLDNILEGFLDIHKALIGSKLNLRLRTTPTKTGSE